MPSASQLSIAARSRIPPPSWILRSTAWRIARTASPLTECPAKAPSRSTTCSQRKPIAANWRACAAGSSLNTVALAISPRTSRTQAPPLRSIAGNRIIRGLSRLVEGLVVVVPGHGAAIDLGVARVGAPAPVPQAFVETDRGALRSAQVEVEHGEPKFAREALDLADDAAADAAAARPGRDKGAGHGAGEGLRLVVARRPRQLRRAGD